MSHGELRVRKKGGGTEEKCRAGNISGDAGFDAAQGLTSANMEGVPVAFQVGSEGAKGNLAVIARWQRFFHDGFAISEQAGKQKAGLDLCAGYRHAVANGFQSSADYAQRRT